MNENDDPWKRLVDAVKTAPLEDHLEPPPPPPTISVQTLRTSVQALLLALTWRKWSLLAALLAGTFFLIFFFFFRDDSPPGESIIPTEPPPSPLTP
jgi:hypothetical protein